MQNQNFPPFQLTRLLTTVFAPKPGERLAVLIDLPDVRLIQNFAFLKQAGLTIQRHAYETFYLGLKNGGLDELKLKGGELFAYKATGGSNLDLPDEVFNVVGDQLSFDKDIYP